MAEQPCKCEVPEARISYEVEVEPATSSEVVVIPDIGPVMNRKKRRAAAAMARRDAKRRRV